MRRRIALALVAGAAILPLLATRAEDRPDKKAGPKEVKVEKAAKFEVPYRLTGTNHLMVRAKINGKGPFHLIVDTGAPAVFITKTVAKKANVEFDEDEKPKGKEKDKVKEKVKEKDGKDAKKGRGLVPLGSFELEGGLKIDNVRARVEDLVQIDGMNTMGLAGIELHGVIGYQVLARYRVEYDLTSDKLVFEPLKFDPPQLVPLAGKGGDDIQSMGPMVKMMAALLGLKPNFDTVPRGFTGIEYEEKDGKVSVTSVLPGGPADKAGLKAGDVITSIKTVSIDRGSDLNKALAKAGVGTKWRFYVTRGGKEEEIVVELGKGL